MIENLDEDRYNMLQSDQEKDWENRCLHCGACCGIKDGDPCEHLQLNDQGKSSCDIYDHRFGLRRTKQGREFKCVPIRNILNKSWPGDDACAYKYKNDCS